MAVSHTDFVNVSIQKRINSIARAIEYRFKEKLKFLEKENATLRAQINEYLGNSVTQIANPLHQIPNTIIQTANPVTHSAKPILSTANPATHTANPVIHTVNPVIYTDNPVIHTANPVIQTLSPFIHTANPVIQTVNPVIQTANPVIQTANPVIQTANPVIQTVNPVIHTANPVIQTANPVIQTVNPVIHTANPVIQTANPVIQTVKTVIQNPNPDLEQDTPLIHPVIALVTVTTENNQPDENIEILTDETVIHTLNYLDPDLQEYFKVCYPTLDIYTLYDILNDITEEYQCDGSFVRGGQIRTMVTKQTGHLDQYRFDNIISYLHSFSKCYYALYIKHDAYLPKSYKTETLYGNSED
jgi:ABC-type transporter Mla subunit MlaD